MKFTSLFNAAVLTLSLIAVPRAGHAGWGFLEPSKIIEKIRQQIAKQELGATLGLIDGEIYRGLSTALQYRIQSEPSYMDGYYTRIDRYSLQTNVSPGDLLDGNDSPFGFNIQQGAEIIFARQFKTQGASIKASPYTLKNLPLNANKAIHNMNVGDFVALQANLGVVFSVGSSVETNPGFSLGGSTHLLLSGDFMIHLFRMSDDKIRVKLITMRKQGKGVDGRFSYTNALKIIGLRFIDNHLDRVIDLQPVVLGFGSSLNDVFMLDYVFDLKNAQAALAFDNFMTKKVHFKDLKVIDPTASRPELANDLMTDMSEVEHLFAEDRDLPSAQRRVDRVFKGSNTSLDASANFKLGLSVIKLTGGYVYSQNQLMSYDRQDNEQHYLLDTYSKEFESRILYGLFGEKVTVGNNLVFESDDSWKPGVFVTLTGYREVKMRNVSHRDFLKVQEQVHSLVSDDQFAKIDWKNWDFSHGSLVNGYFRHQLFINPEAIHALPVQDAKFYYKTFVSYIDKTGTPPTKNGGGGRNRNDWSFDYSPELATISNGLAAIVNPLSGNAIVYQNLKEMQKTALWRDRGIGFILTLLPPWKSGSLVSYEMTFSAKGVDTIDFKFGSFVNEDIYKSMMYIQNIINDRSFDLRLLTDRSTGELKSFH